MSAQLCFLTKASLDQQVLKRLLCDVFLTSDDKVSFISTLSECFTVIKTRIHNAETPCKERLLTIIDYKIRLESRMVDVTYTLDRCIGDNTVAKNKL